MWQNGHIEIHGLQFFYTRTGGTKPPLILAHGMTDDGLCWAPVAEILEADYDVIMVDARGHGQSASPESGYDSLTRAEDLKAVIQALGLQKPLILGHSMGAMTALTLAGLYPDLPAAILLEDPPARWMDNTLAPEERIKRRDGMREWLHSLKEHTLEELIVTQRKAAPTWSDTELLLWAESKLRVSPHVATIFDEAPDVDTWISHLKQIVCPVLLISADPALGAIITAESAAQFQTLIPHASIKQIADAGHSIHREQFDTYMGIVQTFLKGLATT